MSGVFEDMEADTVRSIPFAESSEMLSGDTKDWLVSVTDASDSNVRAPLGHRKIRRVPLLLRKNPKNTKLFDPEVVALGPFHCDDAHLKPMDEHKKAAAKYFAIDSGHPIELVYDKVRGVASEARECYADMSNVSGEEFVNMMFFDGCFLLHFIDLIVGGDGTRRSSSHPRMCSHLQGFIVKDMFLLENQIPHVVLEALMTLKQIDLDKFINIIKVTPSDTLSSTYPSDQNRGGKGGTKDGKEDAKPCHLLDLLRMRLLGEKEEQPPVGAKWNTFRSAMELKEVGIIFKKNKTKCEMRRGIEFKNGFFHSYLSLPTIVVDDLTKSRFLNLIALEMCPDGTSDYGITTYVWLMDRFIDHADDVKELRSQGILLNALGSDEQVAELFNELATDLSPDHSAYLKVIKGIDDHCKNRNRVSVVRMLNTHFSTPWSAIAFFAAVFVVILTVIQTIFTVWPRS